MPRIIVEDQTVQAIKTANGPLELCDRNGDVFAVAIKGDDGQTVVVDLPPLPTDKELREILAQPRFTFEQVLEGLED